MSIDAISPLRQRMIEDMAARKLGRHAQRSHVHSCRRFAAFLGRSPDTATAEDEGVAGQGRDVVIPRADFMPACEALEAWASRVPLQRGSTAGSKETHHQRHPDRVPRRRVAAQQPGATLNRPVPKGGDTFQALPPAAGKGVGKR